jgi:hypothetical protein
MNPVRAASHQCCASRTEALGGCSPAGPPPGHPLCLKWAQVAAWAGCAAAAPCAPNLLVARSPTHSTPYSWLLHPPHALARNPLALPIPRRITSTAQHHSSHDGLLPQWPNPAQHAPTAAPRCGRASRTSPGGCTWARARSPPAASSRRIPVHVVHPHGQDPVGGSGPELVGVDSWHGWSGSKARHVAPRVASRREGDGETRS